MVMLNSDEKINELNKIVKDQEKEIEMFKSITEKLMNARFPNENTVESVLNFKVIYLN